MMGKTMTVALAMLCCASNQPALKRMLHRCVFATFIVIRYAPGTAKMGRVVPLCLTAATCACCAVSAVSPRKLWIAATVETLLYSHSWRT
jgi:hypothetical protein